MAQMPGLLGLEIQAGLRTNSDPDGGFLVPDALSTELGPDLERKRLRCGGWPIWLRFSAGDYQRPISQGGAVAGWVGETDTRAETGSPGLAMFAPPWSEVYALPEVTQKLLDLSSFDVAAWLIDEISISENELEGAAFILGDGVGKPKGILRYDTVANASWTFGKVGYIPSGHATLLNSADTLIDLQHSLKPVYRQAATWLMNDATWALIRKFKDGDGNYLWRPGLEKGAPDMLLGKPVEIDDNMPAIGAGAYPLAFGDFQRAYTIGGHTAGRRLLRDPLTKKGWVKFYSSKRVFGGLHNSEAVKLLKIAAA
jgi:HK97 family phage major capsid protein